MLGQASECWDGAGWEEVCREVWVEVGREGERGCNMYLKAVPWSCVLKGEKASV